MTNEPVPFYEVEEAVDLEAAVEGLLRLGVDETQIAAALRIPRGRVTKIAKFSHGVKTFSTRLNPKDRELADAMRDMAWEAYREGMVTLKVGSPAEKQALVRAILARSMALIGAEKDTRLEELREEFDGLVSAIRGDSPEVDFDLPTDDSDAFTIDAVLRNAHDSD